MLQQTVQPAIKIKEDYVETSTEDCHDTEFSLSSTRQQDYVATKKRCVVTTATCNCEKLCHDKVEELKVKISVETKKFMSRRNQSSKKRNSIATTNFSVVTNYSSVQNAKATKKCRDTRKSCRNKNKKVSAQFYHDIIKVCRDRIQEEIPKSCRDRKLQATTRAGEQR